jgi:signal transduction histidine kinase
MTQRWRLLPASLGRRILLLHGVVTVALLVAMVGLLRLNAVHRDDLAAATRALVNEQALANRITNAVLRQIVAATYYGDERGNDAVRAAFDEAGEEAYLGIRQYLFNDLNTEERLKLEQVKEYHQRLEVTAVRALDLLRRGETATARIATDSMIAHALGLQNALADFLRMREEAPGRIEERQSTIFHSLALGTAGLMVLVLLTAVSMGGYLRQRLTGPLTTLNEAAGRIADGDLSVRLPAFYAAELAAVADSFNRMVGRLGKAKDALEQRNQDLEGALDRLRSTRDELVQSEKLSAVGRMMAGLAHELNNPLASVLGFGELLARRIDEGEVIDADARKELLDPILREGARARALIRNLLRFSRKAAETTGPVNLAESLGVVVALRRYAFKQAGLELVVVDVPDTWVIAESQRLQQVLLNVMNNALDAMAPAGSGSLRIHCVPTETSVTLVLADEGPGLDDPSRIFEPFYTTKAEDQGTGLGLALVKQFMEGFQGTVAAENRPGGAGASFLLGFRAATAPEPAPAEAASGAADAVPGPRPGSRILVVEDEPALQRLQERMLDRVGATVVIAGSANEAREVLLGTSVDMVVSDFRMPGGTGLDLYRWIVAERPALADRFIIVTGDVTDPELADFAARWPERIVHKPFQFDDYLGAVGARLA